LVIVYQQGLETGIAAYFITLLVYKLYEFDGSWRVNEISKRQIAMLGVIAILTMFSRLDLVFLAGMVGFWIVFRGHILQIHLPLDITSIVVATLLAFLVRVPLPEYYEISHLALVMTGLALVVKISVRSSWAVPNHTCQAGIFERLKTQQAQLSALIRQFAP
jgi:hypothetical protein